MNSKQDVLSPGKAVLLHLLPGAAVAIVYSIIVRTVSDYGYPKVVALGLSALVAMVPFEVGYMLYASKKRFGSFSLSKVVDYRERVPLKDYLIFVPVLFVWAGIMFALTKPISNALLEKAFHWLPGWYVLDDKLESFPPGALLVTFISTFFVTGIILPIVEELYFRGFLLPRIPGKYAALSNTVLFSLYHFWSPWQFVSRVLAIYPLAYIVQRKRSVYLGIAAHCTLNILGDSVAVLVLLLK